MKYQLILADPPWLYLDKSLSHGGGAESHYKCLDTADICRLNVNEIAADNAVLILWTTFPQLKEALKVMKNWGFMYKTVAWVWVKTNNNGSLYMGMGHYTRANVEACLIGIKGKGLERKDNRLINVFRHKRLGHSEKPPVVRQMLESLYGDVTRIELFARQKPEKGWDVWGNEVKSDIELTFKPKPEPEEKDAET